MSQEKDQKITVDVSGVERVMRRLIAAKEIIDAAIDAGADLLAQARQPADQPKDKDRRPATFGSARQNGEPAESAADLGWSQVEGVDKP